jgi:hypothetical protein
MNRRVVWDDEGIGCGGGGQCDDDCLSVIHCSVCSIGRRRFTADVFVYDRFSEFL